MKLALRPAMLDKFTGLLYSGRVQLKQRPETLVGHKAQDETEKVLPK